jgi:hypothetical protein
MIIKLQSKKLSLLAWCTHSTHQSHPHLCEAVSHGTGPVKLPTTLMAKCNSNLTTVQQDLMAEVIVAMGTACFDNKLLTAASIAEMALHQASGTRIPIKFFQCPNLPKHNDKAHHLWRDCPNKADHEAWKNFQIDLQNFRKEQQARNAQRGGFEQASLQRKSAN